MKKMDIHVFEAAKSDSEFRLIARGYKKVKVTEMGEIITPVR